MRADMFKIIIERPRWGSRHAPAVKLRNERDPHRKFVGLNRQVQERGIIRKSLSENLAPLKRFLQKQRGRDWDDVFSEICQHLDTGSTVKMHVREHIEDFIMIRIHVDADGQWFGHHERTGLRPLSGWWPDLYVDPVDGTIRETQLLCDKLGVERRAHYTRWGSYDEGPFDDFQQVSPREILMMRKGIWFQCLLDSDPDCSLPQLRHELLNQTWREHERWSVVSTKQLSKKELKKNDLTNQGGTP
jgi:hypothetical protein